MGAEREDEDRGASESSGLEDIMELGAAFGADEDEDSSPLVVGTEADSDELDNLSAGYGGMAAQSLVEADASDLVGEAANAPTPAASSLTAAKVAKTEIAPEAPAKPKADPPKAKATTGSERAVKTTEADASAAAALVASTAAAAHLSEVRKVTPAAAPEQERSSGGGMMWMVVVVVLALLGGGYWWVFVRGGADTHQTAKAAAEPPRKEEPELVAKAEPPEPEPEPEPAPAVVEEPKLDVPAVAEEEEEAEVVEEPVETAVESSARKTKRRPKDDGEKDEAKAEPPPKEPEPEPEPEPEKKEAPPPQLTEDQYRTECLLNPNKPGCAEAKRKYGDKYKDLDKTLPDKLSESDVRSGVSPVKGQAKACGAKHGVAPGTVVRVKLSIEGETGKVLSASAMGEHAGTPVGNCVADALKDAKFRRFKSGQQGTTYPVTM